MIKQLFHRGSSDRVPLEAAPQDIGHFRIDVSDISWEDNGIVGDFTFTWRNLVWQLSVNHEEQGNAPWPDIRFVADKNTPCWRVSDGLWRGIMPGANFWGAPGLENFGLLGDLEGQSKIDQFYLAVDQNEVLRLEVEMQDAGFVDDWNCLQIFK